MDPVRISVLGLPGVGVLWLLTLVAFGVFGWRVWQLIGLLRRGRYENRFDQPGRRAWHAVKNVLLQPRIFGERSIGLAHFLIFWGFVVYATCFNWALLRGLFPFLPIPYPDEVGPRRCSWRSFRSWCWSRWPWPWRGACSMRRRICI